MDAEAEPGDALATQLHDSRRAHQAFIRSRASARLRRTSFARHRATPLYDAEDLV